MNTENRDGSTTSTRAPVLNRRIPSGAWGRHLTSAECRALRALGWSVSERCIVSSAGADYLGVIYRPARTGGYAHAGIYVETRA